MMQFKFHRICLAAALALATALPAQALILNGGFESGDFTGWAVSGDTGYTGVDAFVAHSGNFGAYFGEEAPGSSIQQSFATTVGVPYLVEFWLQLDDSATPSSFAWSWDGAAQTLLTDASGFSYAYFSGVVTATSAISTLRFDLMNQQSFFLLDDISVTAVPEPGTAALALLGIAAFGAYRRLGRRASAD